MSVKDEDDCVIVKEEEVPPEVVITEKKDCQNLRPDGSSKLGSKLQCQNTKDRAIPCTKCSETFGSVSLLNEHKITVHGFFIQNCEICGRAVTGRGHMPEHFRQYHPDRKIFKCGFCGKSFKWRGEVAWHKKMEHKHGPWERKTRTTTSKTSKIEAKDLQCRICQKSFHTRLRFERHMKTKHVVQSGCNKCEEVFRTFLDVKYHDCSGKEQSASGEKCFICGICGASFTTQKHLIGHMGLHTGELKTACRLCNIGFSGSESYEKHKNEFHRKTEVLP